jgi:hypothetical protein
MINHDVLLKADDYKNEFESAQLHRHVCIDNFFDRTFADHLLEQFPPFDNQKAVNEFGEIGPKCVHTNIKLLGSAYSDLHDYIRSQTFLNAISRITGIPDLLPDPNMYGGGTHENVDGAELDPHVDFNYDPDTGYHRRLNVLFYLNHEWNESWGGAIEFHSNPVEWREGGNKIISYNCVFNRCVIFATGEESWHGFKRINLPQEKKAAAISRKLISIYLYTKTRPDNEIAPSHGTFYIPYPPKRLEEQSHGTHMLKDEYRKDAIALTSSEYTDILRLTEKRDRLLKNAFEIEKKLSGRIESYGRYINELFSAIHPVLKGYVAPVAGGTHGYFHDKWVLQDFHVKIICSKKVTGAVLRGWLPKDQVIKLLISTNDTNQKEFIVKEGVFDISLKKDIIRADAGTLTINIKSLRLSGNKNSSDNRGDLQFILNEIEFSH